LKGQFGFFNEFIDGVFDGCFDFKKVSFWDEDIPFMDRGQFDDEINDEKLEFGENCVEVSFGSEEESIKEQIGIKDSPFQSKKLIFTGFH
jgi:hypothetical protein